MAAVTNNHYTALRHLNDQWKPWRVIQQQKRSHNSSRTSKGRKRQILWKDTYLKVDSWRFHDGRTYPSPQCLSQQASSSKVMPKKQWGCHCLTQENAQHPGALAETGHFWIDSELRRAAVTHLSFQRHYDKWICDGEVGKMEGQSVQCSRRSIQMELAEGISNHSYNLNSCFSNVSGTFNRLK